jgi:hypothetical protein
LFVFGCLGVWGFGSAFVFVWFCLGWVGLWKGKVTEFEIDVKETGTVLDS